LVAINPFKRLQVYGPGWVKHYKGKRIGLAAPHIYAVSEAAYNAMVEHKKNQSVLVRYLLAPSLTPGYSITIQSTSPTRSSLALLLSCPCRCGCLVAVVSRVPERPSVPS